MKKGDKVIYMFVPDKYHPISSIMSATILKTSKENFFPSSDYTIHPIERIYGEGGTHDQMAKEQLLYEIGDRKVIKMIFEKGLSRR